MVKGKQIVKMTTNRIRMLFGLFLWIVIAAVARATIYEDVISMPTANVTENTYLCLAKSVSVLSGHTVVGYEINNIPGVAHHVSMAIAEAYYSDVDLWDCRSQQGAITYGKMWSLGGKDGEGDTHAFMMYQPDVGLEVGADKKLNYIILQVHYANVTQVTDIEYPPVNLTLFTTTERRPYAVQKLMLLSMGYIPANSVFSSEVATVWKGGTVNIVSYVIHTHDYGLWAEGFLIRNGHAILIGRKNVVFHGQSKYAMEEPLEMKLGDVIAARCVYENTEDFPVVFGSRREDEMCNYSIEYRFPAEETDLYPVAYSYSQDAQISTWCNESVPGTRVLCMDPIVD